MPPAARLMPSTAGAAHRADQPRPAREHINSQEPALAKPCATLPSLTSLLSASEQPGQKDQNGFAYMGKFPIYLNHGFRCFAPARDRRCR